MGGTTGRSLRLEALKISLPDVQYKSYIEGKGWEAHYAKSGELSGTTGESLRIQAIKIRLTGDLAEQYDILYRTHSENLGWSEWAKNDEVSGTEAEPLRMEQDWVKNGELAGTTGESLRLEALEIKLDDSLAQKYDIHYRAHVQNIGWQDWVKNGELAGTTGESLRLEALEIKLLPKNAYTNFE